MQEGFSMILLAVVNGQPKEMGLIQAIKHFIDHRVDVVRRRTAFLLQKAKDREHILEGYLTALDHLDNVIDHPRQRQPRRRPRKPGRLLRRQEDRHQHHRTRSEARRRQAVHREAGRRHPRTATASPDQAFDRRNLERVEAGARAHRRIRIDSRSEKKLRKVIIKELEEVKKLYGDARRTVIEDEAAEIMLEDLIADEQVAVTVSHSGYMKRTPISTYRMQRRGGTGAPA
jgi:DNA gyrase subunit A